MACFWLCFSSLADTEAEADAEAEARGVEEAGMMESITASVQAGMGKEVLLGTMLYVARLQAGLNVKEVAATAVVADCDSFP